METARSHVLWGTGLGAAQVIALQMLTWAGLGLTYWTWVSTDGLVAVFAVFRPSALR